MFCCVLATVCSIKVQAMICYGCDHHCAFGQRHYVLFVTGILVSFATGYTQPFVFFMVSPSRCCSIATTHFTSRRLLHTIHRPAYRSHQSSPAAICKAEEDTDLYTYSKRAERNLWHAGSRGMHNINEMARQNVRLHTSFHTVNVAGYAKSAGE